MAMPEDISISDAVAPRRAAIVLSAGALGLVLAGTVALWAHYGSAIFFEMIRAGLSAIGLRLFAPEGHRSNTVTAVHSPVPAADQLTALLTTLRTRYGLVLAGGQGELKGRIFRVGHLGMIDEGDAYSILATIEQGMADHGMLSRVGGRSAAHQTNVKKTLTGSSKSVLMLMG